IIFIPSNINNIIYVLGAVANPQPLHYTEGMRVLDAVLGAGGFTEFAKEDSVTIIKKNKEKLRIDLKKVKKGKSYPVINLSEYKIQIPKEGLYIGVEWITTKENGVERKSTNEKKLPPIYLYQPHFGLELSNYIENRWYFTNGSWHKNQNYYLGRYGQLAAEITLSD
ncbi:MAG: SLBB domain-containing protein, partial [Bacteroidales bacterium]|nr:SLBB domain-containing protein [Bacteroidales bacterium]